MMVAYRGEEGKDDPFGPPGGLAGAQGQGMESRPTTVLKTWPLLSSLSCSPFDHFSPGFEAAAPLTD